MKHLEDAKSRSGKKRELSGEKGPDGFSGKESSRPRRRGTWWSYGGNVGMVEGVDFAPDSVEGGADMGDTKKVADRKRQVSSDILDIVTKVARVDRVARMEAAVAGREDVVVATEDDADTAGIDTVDIGLEYVINEDMETKEQWVTDLHILFIPAYASYVYRKVSVVCDGS